MRVLQINSVYGVGSTGRIVKNLHEVIIKMGYEGYIAYGRGTLLRNSNTIRIGDNFDIYKHFVITRLFDRHGFGSKGATREFINKIEEIDPDIIHLHNIHGYYINIEILFNYLKEINRPIVWTLHDCWAFTGHCAYFDFIGCDKWKIGCERCPQKSRYPKSILLDSSKYNYQRKKELFTGIKNMTIVTPSKWLANLVKESFLKEYDVRVIYNGIDLKIFSPKDDKSFKKKYGIENKFIILGVANIWDYRKGLRYFFDLSQMIDNNSVIVLVGLNKKQLKNLPSNIIGIEKTNNIEELAEIYSSADVFVNPTLEDNFPTTNLEALACGVPVITFNTGGSPESVDDHTGMVIEKGNMKQLIDGINYFKKVNRTAYSSNCRKRAEMLYDMSITYNEYINLYQFVYRNFKDVNTCK